jgi:hypothetical protein
MTLPLLSPQTRNGILMMVRSNLQRCKLSGQAKHWGRAVALASTYLFFLGAAVHGQDPLQQPARVPDLYPTPPAPQRVFRLESESQLRERMTREAQQALNPLKLRYDITFPSYPPVPPPEYAARPWEPIGATIEPPYLCHGRLYFEQINAERYGWNLGPLHPLISAGIFYADVVTFPYHAATDPLRRYECNTGYELPGTAMPLLWYRSELNLPGLAAEAATIGLLIAIFP